MAWEVKFAEAPAAGLALMVDGQRFDLVSVQPHTRADGQASSLLTWRAACLDCGKPFELVEGLRFRLGARRCPEHRKPGVKAR